MHGLLSRRRLGWLVAGLLSLALVAAACEEDVDNDLFAPADEPTPAVTPADEPPPAVTPAEPADPAQPAELRGEVVEVEGSGAFGELLLTEIDGQVNAIVTITGLEEGAHTHDIRAGSCAAMTDDDEVVHELGEMQVGGDGHASAAGELPGALEDYDTGHYYAVQAEDGTTVACADFEGEPGLGAPANGVQPGDPDDDEEDDGNGQGGA